MHEEQDDVVHDTKTEIEGLFLKVLRNNAVAKHTYEAAKNEGLNQEYRIMAMVVQLSEQNSKLMNIIMDAKKNETPIVLNAQDVHRMERE